MVPPRNPIHEEEVESRWEAAPAIGLVIAFQLLLALVSRARSWHMGGLPWWVWLQRTNAISGAVGDHTGCLP